MDVFQKVPKTGTAFSTTEVYHPQKEGERQVLGSYQDPWDEEAWRLLFDDKALMVHTREEEFSVNDLNIYELVGKGTFGKAYTCVLKGKQLVVKIPKKASVREYQAGMKHDYEGGIIGGENYKRIEPWDPMVRDSSSTLKKSMENFTAEMEHYELMMEGEKFRSLRGFKQRWIRLIETSAEANRQQYERLREEALRLRQHPGFKHMHQLFHLQWFGEWPVLFSAPCESSLYNLLQKFQDENMLDLRPEEVNGEPFYQPSKLWIVIAKQMTLAMEFMKSVKFVHLDIKPENILYRHKSDGQIEFMMSDYGICGRTYRKWPGERSPGTFIYRMPTWMMEEKTCWELAVFQWASTLISIIDNGVNDGSPSFGALEIDPKYFYSSRYESGRAIYRMLFADDEETDSIENATDLWSILDPPSHEYFVHLGWIMNPRDEHYESGNSISYIFDTMAQKLRGQEMPL